jgi:hypothetical protein
MDAIKAANLGLAFLLELGGLAALGYWGYQTGTGPLRWVLAIGAPLLLAVIWGVFLSPQATVRLPETLTTPLRPLLLLLTAAALASAGQPILAGIFGVAIVISGVLDGSGRRRTRPPPIKRRR